MNKINFLLITILCFVIIFLSSYKNTRPGDIKLNNLNDSINYSLGLWQGNVFRQQYFATDSTGKQLEAFIDALNVAYQKESDPDELYELGKKVGKYLIDNLESGIFGEHTDTVDTEILIMGIINAFIEYQDVMSLTEANSIVNAAQTRTQNKMSVTPK